MAARAWAIRWNSPLPWSTASIPANSKMHPHIFTVAEEASPTERMRAPARSSGGEGGGSWGTGLPSPVRRASSSPERVTAPKSSQPSRRLPKRPHPTKVTTKAAPGATQKHSIRPACSRVIFPCSSSRETPRAPAG